MTQIAGSTVLITGGASGLGRQMGLQLARGGARIVVWDINAESLSKVVDELEEQGALGASGYVCDVSDKEAVAKTAAKVKNEVGEVDILINNAGVVSGRTILDLTDRQIEQTFGVNVLALFWVTRAFLPNMVARNRGHIVNMASASGLVGVAKLGDYSASKWAAIGFDESLRVELRHLAPQVKTTVVCPFYVNTGMFDGVTTRFSFLLPILKEKVVASRVVMAIEKNQGRVIMPPMVYLVPPMRLLPLPVFDWLVDFFGINKSMEHFKGRLMDIKSASKNRRAS